MLLSFSLVGRTGDAPEPVSRFGPEKQVHHLSTAHLDAGFLDPKFLYDM